MKTDLFTVIQALNNKFNLELELPAKNFELTKAIVVDNFSANFKDIHNCIVYIKFNSISIPIGSFNDCIIISYNCGNGVSEKRFHIESQRSLQLFDFLISKGYANEPFGIDEMQMVRWETPKNTVERTILGYPVNDLKSSFIIGPGARVGISGDRFYYGENQILKQVTSIGGVKIGKNVIIGANVVIYRGHTGLTEIADNTIIGANSVIYGDSKVKGYIEPNTIYK